VQKNPRKLWTNCFIAWRGKECSSAHQDEERDASAGEYIAPEDMLAGRQREMHVERWKPPESIARIAARGPRDR
jgi:hypothetical protein